MATRSEYQKLSLVLGAAIILTPHLVAQSVPATAKLPSGTVIAIRTIDPIDSSGKVSGKDYNATLDDSVILNGVTVAPLGSPAVLRLVEVQHAGAIKGRASVSVRLVAVEIAGERLTVNSAAATIKSASQGASTAKKAGIGGLIGGVIGGILGGVDGAAKGALLGGAAGVGVASGTGQKVKIASETRLSFTVVEAETSDLFATIVSLEKEISGHAMRGDRDRVALGLDPAFAGTFNGQPFTRDQFLSSLRPQPNQIASDLEAPEVYLDEGRAVVSGVWVSQSKKGSKVETVRQSFTDVFILNNGRWFLLKADITQ